MEPPRITELSNELTWQIDTADPLGIVRQLCQSDAQLFAGWGGHPSVNDASVLEKLSEISRKTYKLLKENREHGKNNIFVFSGCGTSGRMAWLCSRAYNRLLGQFGHAPCFHYLISGGDKSLIISNELPEDDPPQGVEDLKRVCEGADHVVFFGITCGLSAPYVAGQIDHAMQQPNMTTVLMGFNPVSLARNAPIEKWHKTCREVFVELERRSASSDEAVILNPVVGPEPITGSSRMKGGSMTAVLLDTVFLSALQSLLELSVTSAAIASCPPGTRTEERAREKPQGLVFQHSLPPSLSPVTGLLDCYALTYRAVYRHAVGVASLVGLCASCLCQPSGRLVYLGADTLGAVGLIDASEMVDTYGADLEEIRGFVQGGWETCRNTEGDLSGCGKLFRVSLSQFESDLLPLLTTHDCVLCVQGKEASPQLQALMDRVLSGPARCGLVVVAEEAQSELSSHLLLLDSRYETTLLLSLPHYNAFGVESVFAGFGLKLVLNAVSTGANIMKGRVHGNTMINLTLSNDKLFYRSVDIIRELSGASRERATTALLQAMYREDDVGVHEDELVSLHIKVANSQNMVVPLALLLASGQCSSVVQAEQLLSSTQSISTLINPPAANSSHTHS